MDNNPKEEPATSNDETTNDDVAKVESADTTSSQGEESSQTEQQPSKIPIVEPKKSYKKMIIIIATIVVALLLAGGAIGYFLFMKELAGKNTQQQSSVVAEQEPQAEEEPVSPAMTLVDTAKTVMKADVVDATQNEELYGEIADGTVVYSVPSYQLNDNDFSNYPTEGYGAAVSSPEAETSVIKSDYEALVALLSDEELEEKRSFNGGIGGGESAIYASDEVVCNISSVYALRGVNYAGIGCADIVSYEAGAEAVKPFYDAYLRSTPEIPETDEFVLQIGAPEINDGVEGYKNASTSITYATGFMGLFYQEPATEDWTFYTGVQDTPSCDSFDTSVLQNAFAGQPCADGSGNTAVVKAE